MQCVNLHTTVRKSKKHLVSLRSRNSPDWELYSYCLSAPIHFYLGIYNNLEHCTQILRMTNAVAAETSTLSTWNAVGQDQTNIVNYYGNKQELSKSTTVLWLFPFHTNVFINTDQILEKSNMICATFKSADDLARTPECHSGTRTVPIAQNMDSLSAPDGPRMCWLSGMMGMGKSAVARSIA
jgi:hypothetical protein